MASKLKEQTIARLNWLKGRLKRNPNHYDQGAFCGTQACLAGFCYPKAFNLKKVVTLDQATFEKYAKKSGLIDEYGAPDYDKAAAQWLGITPLQSYRLFSGYWHGGAERFNRRLADTNQQAVAKAIERIDRFISSNGRV